MYTKEIKRIFELALSICRCNCTRVTSQDWIRENKCFLEIRGVCDDSITEMNIELRELCTIEGLDMYLFTFVSDEKHLPEER